MTGIVHREDLWRLRRDELTGEDVRADSWDSRGRWFSVVVVATLRLALTWSAAVSDWQDGPGHGY